MSSQAVRGWAAASAAGVPHFPLTRDKEAIGVFPLHIQHEINATAATEERLQAGWPEAVVLRHWRQSTWYELPYFFLPAFPKLALEQVRSFATFGRLFANAIFIHDRVADSDVAAHDAATTTLRIMAMQFEAYRLLLPLFPATSPFWERLRGDLSAYADACIEERRFASGERPWSDLTEEVALRIAAGKSGVSRVIVAGLAELGQEEGLIAPLTSALDHYNIACQMWDDLNDWRDDLQHRVPSLLLVRVVPARPTDQDPGALRRETGRLAREIYYGGHAGYVLELALSSLDAADRAKELAPTLPWFGLTEILRRKYQAALQDLTRIMKSNVLRARKQSRLTLSLPEAPGGFLGTAWAGARFLVQQWQRGFGEARDIAQFAEEVGFSSGSGARYGDVFQRALILDALCEADEVLLGQLRPLLDAEADYLLSRRLTTGIGGWAYFQDLPELPPDADDLAQIMQALLRVGRRADVVAHAEEPLEVLLRDGALPDGSLKTWIVPAANRTLEQERQAEFVERLWNDGAHDEVIGNLLYALKLYDGARFEAVIKRGTAYLEGRQHSDGTWSSMWYHGYFYAVYVGVRLFAVERPGSPFTRRALAFLRSGQRADGGWGVEGEESDALSTALSLLALAAGGRCSGDAGDPARAHRALSFLASTRGEDGSWPSQKLIYVGRGTCHGSRTLTTTFVMKAALCWHRHEVSLALALEGEAAGRLANGAATAHLEAS